MFFRLTNDTTYLTGNEGQKFEQFYLKMLRCQDRVLPTFAANVQSANFIAVENAHAVIMLK